MTGPQRQARLRTARAENGMVQCNVWVPSNAVADIKRAAEMIRANPTLTIASLVDTLTGKLSSLKAKPNKNKGV
jgi:hypothetical protein